MLSLQTKKKRLIKPNLQNIKWTPPYCSSGVVFWILPLWRYKRSYTPYILTVPPGLFSELSLYDVTWVIPPTHLLFLRGCFLNSPSMTLQEELSPLHTYCSSEVVFWTLPLWRYKRSYPPYTLTVPPGLFSELSLYDVTRGVIPPTHLLFLRGCFLNSPSMMLQEELSPLHTPHRSFFADDPMT